MNFLTQNVRLCIPIYRLTSNKNYTTIRLLSITVNNASQHRKVQKGTIVTQQSGVSTKAKAQRETVYVGSINTPIKALKIFSLSTSAFGIVLQPAIFKGLSSMHPAICAVFISFYGFYTFVTPFLLHWFVKRYVTQLEFDQNAKIFTAKTLNFFGREQEHSFTAEDVHVPDLPGPFTSFLAKEKPLLIDYKLFKDLDVYSHMMGYDKPIDFQIPEEALRNSENVDNTEHMDKKSEVTSENLDQKKSRN